MTDSNDTNEQNRKNPLTAYDSPWKDILKTYVPLCGSRRVGCQWHRKLLTITLFK